LTDPATGADLVVGTVNLEYATALKGQASVRVSVPTASYLQEGFTAVNDLYVSFYLRINTLPTAQEQILQISNSGTNVGNIVLLTNGKLRLRRDTTTVGKDTSPLVVGTIYRVGIRQKRGTGSNAILEGYVAVGDAAFGSAFASTPSGTWNTSANQIQFGALTGTNLSATFDNILLDSAAMPPPSTSSAFASTSSQSGFNASAPNSNTGIAFVAASLDSSFDGTSTSSSSSYLCEVPATQEAENTRIATVENPVSYADEQSQASGVSSIPELALRSKIYSEARFGLLPQLFIRDDHKDRVKPKPNYGRLLEKQATIPSYNTVVYVTRGVGNQDCLLDQVEDKGNRFNAHARAPPAASV
jgi:hypothetical protein